MPHRNRFRSLSPLVRPSMPAYFLVIFAQYLRNCLRNVLPCNRITSQKHKKENKMSRFSFWLLYLVGVFFVTMNFLYAPFAIIKILFTLMVYCLFLFKISNVLSLLNEADELTKDYEVKCLCGPFQSCNKCKRD